MMIMIINFLLVLLTESVSTLTCSFDNGLCGWTQDLNVTKRWLLHKGTSPYLIFTNDAGQNQATLEYHHFTGMGYLWFSCVPFGSVKLEVLVGKKSVFSVQNKRKPKTMVWSSVGVNINSTNETVSIQGSVRYGGILGLDDLVFKEKNETMCDKLAPANGTLNCTLNNTVHSVCSFRCPGGVHVVGSPERECLPSGMWSGYNASCQLSLRLTNGKENYGKVEALIDGKWGALCRNKDINSDAMARVVCRTLGYSAEAFELPSYEVEPELEDAWIEIQQCSGSEKTILDCKRTAVERRACNLDSGIYVLCGNFSCPPGCSCESSSPLRYTIICTSTASRNTPLMAPPYTTKISMEGVDMSHLTKKVLKNIPIIHDIIFMKATIEIVKNGTFASRLPNLRLIDLSGNCLSSLASIESGWYGNKAVSHTLILILNDNKIRNITKYSTKGKGMLNSLGLKRNLISFIEEGAFEELHWLEHVDLSNNLIANLEPNTFVGIGKEIFNIMIDVSSNRLTFIKRGVFAQDLYINSLILFNNSIEAIEEGSINSIHLDTLDIRNNMLKDISILPWGSLDDIFYLYLGNNSIQNLTVKMFEGKKNLRILDIGYNELGIIRKDLFTGLKTMLFLNAVKSSIRYIEDNAFQKNSWLGYLFLDGNELTKIGKLTFTGLQYILYITMSNNPLQVIEEGAFQHMTDLQALYLIQTNIRTININSFGSKYLEIAHNFGENLQGIEVLDPERIFLQSAGYRCTSATHTIWQFCFPCQQGEFKIDVRERGCRKCPPGGFYQDRIAHVGEIVHGLGCKQCPPGTYVSIANAPGRTEASCSACPEGTNLKRFAGFRACPCLENFYRFDRFGRCMESPLGYKSINETVDLRPGFYWIWSEDEVRKSYITFSAKLQEENQGYDAELKSFNEILPPAYPCPFIGSCKGGFDANCSHGYEGILCAVCSRGFYKMFSGCNECPSVYLFVGQCLAVFIVVAIITFVIVKDKKARSERSAADNIFSSLKIVIGFYQVTSGTLRAYSYIQWPTALTKLMKFADVVQLNIFKLVPMECLSHSIKITPYVGLVTYVSLNVLVILLAMGYLYARKVFLKMKNVNQEERNKNLFACKANCYRAVFLFLFVTYPATCEKVFQVLPFGCTKVCDNQQTCNWYLRSDYSVQCYTSVYNKYALLAFFALLIPVLFPVVTVIMLWKYCRNHVQYKNATASVKGFSERKLTKKALLKQEKKRKEENEVSVGMRFIYENYSTDCWYWEVIELVRKLILTAVVVHSGREGRSFLGISAIFSGFYAIFFAQSKPVPYIFDHWLHLGSLLGTLANQLMGMLLKIPVENESSLVNEEDDSVGVHVLLICANVMVLVMLAVRYIYSVAFALMIVKENPQCSGSCIMTVMQVVALENGKEEVIRRHRAGSFEKKRGVQGFNP